MRKPDELIELLETLRESITETSVNAGPDAEAIVYIGKQELKLPSRDCVLLLNDEETVEGMFDAIGAPTSATILLNDLDITEDVRAALEERFSSVDEQ